MQTEVRAALVTEDEARRYLGNVSRAMIYKLRGEGLIHPVHLETRTETPILPKPSFS